MMLHHPSLNDGSSQFVGLRHWIALGPEVLDQGAKVAQRKNCVSRMAKIKHLMQVNSDKFNPSYLVGSSFFKSNDIQLIIDFWNVKFCVGWSGCSFLTHDCTGMWWEYLPCMNDQGNLFLDVILKDWQWHDMRWQWVSDNCWMNLDRWGVLLWLLHAWTEVPWVHFLKCNLRCFIMWWQD